MKKIQGFPNFRGIWLGRQVAFLLLTLSGCLCLPIVHQARAAYPVINPRLTTDSSLDTSSAAAVVRQIIKPGMSDEEKAQACWRFMMDYFYHWYPPQEESVPSYVFDFAKAINSYGYGPCYVNAPVLCSLWEAAGFATRVWYLGGHTVAEVKYGGGWHLIDADARGWHRKADGQIASVEELAANAALFLSPREKSTPYYPFAAPDVVATPLIPWSNPSRMMDLYLSREDNWLTNHQAVNGHPMYLTLRPGESISLSASNQGRWNRDRTWFVQEEEAVWQAGPVDISGKLTYGNGELNWHVPLADGKKQADKVLWIGSANVRQAEAGLAAKDPSQPAFAVFRLVSPYVLVEGKVRTVMAADASPSWPSFEISTDGGYLWTPLAKPAWSIGGKFGNCKLDVSRQVSGRYEYLFRVRLGKTPLAQIDFLNTFQHAPLALPKLRPGKNEVTIHRGPDEGHVQLVLGEKQMTSGRYLFAQSGALDLSARVAPKNFGEPASVVYRLAAPEVLTGLSVGAQLGMEAAGEQSIEASYSLDQGKSWISIWREVNLGNPRETQIEKDKRVTFDPSTTAKEVLVRFAMCRNSANFGINGLRLYAFYRQPQSEKAKLGMDLVWLEKRGANWVEKKQTLTVVKYPHTMALVCSGEAVKLKQVTMSVMR